MKAWMHKKVTVHLELSEEEAKDLLTGLVNKAYDDKYMVPRTRERELTPRVLHIIAELQTLLS